MTVERAIEAVEFAEETIAECEHPDEFEEISDYAWVRENAPRDFSDDQCDLVQRLLEREYLKSIGRA